jgi:hypothetical protein
MNFLGIYNLFMALAVAGACGACDYRDTAPGYSAGSDYVVARDNGDELPPARYIINAPPTRIDNGYWSGFYWNRPHDDEDAADYTDGDSGDRGYAASGYGYRGGDAEPQYGVAAVGATAGMGYGVATYGGYGSYGNGNYAGGDEDYGDDENYTRPVYYRTRHEHHRHRDADNRYDRGDGRDAGDDSRHDADRGRQDYDAHVTVESHRGYNGHDSHMFDADHRPGNKMSAGYQVHDTNGNGRDRPQQQERPTSR